MKWYVFYEKGEGAVSESGMEDYDTREAAEAFAAELLREDKSTSYYIVEGKLVGQGRYGRVFLPE